MYYRLSNAALEQPDVITVSLCLEGGLVFPTSVLFRISFVSFKIPRTFRAID